MLSTENVKCDVYDNVQDSIPRRRPLKEIVTRIKGCNVEIKNNLVTLQKSHRA